MPQQTGEHLAPQADTGESHNSGNVARSQEQWAERLNRPVEICNAIGMRLRLIPPGDFLMGSTDTQVDAAVREAKAFGIHDLHGNLYEFCSDFFGYYDAGPRTDPTGPPLGNTRFQNQRVVRSFTK